MHVFALKNESLIDWVCDSGGLKQFLIVNASYLVLDFGECGLDLKYFFRNPI